MRKAWPSNALQGRRPPSEFGVIEAPGANPSAAHPGILMRYKLSKDRTSGEDTHIPTSLRSAAPAQTKEELTAPVMQNHRTSNSGLKTSASRARANPTNSPSILPLRQFRSPEQKTLPTSKPPHRW
jgi:hypothetical protein